MSSIELEPTGEIESELSFDNCFEELILFYILVRAGIKKIKKVQTAWPLPFLLPQSIAFLNPDRMLLSFVATRFLFIFFLLKQLNIEI